MTKRGNIKDEMWQLSKKLIAIESTEGNKGAQEECFDILENYFQKDFIAKRIEEKGRLSLILSTKRGKVFDVICSGHVDVVPGESVQFSLKKENGKWYGRGAYDMKSALVASLLAVRDYKKSGGKKAIAFLITADEEKDGLSTQILLSKHKYQSKFVIIPDGGDYDEIVLKQKGFLQVEVMLSGKSSHVSQPWNGENPLNRLFEISQALRKGIVQPTKNAQWETSVELTKVETDNSINQIPETVRAFFDIRFISKQHKEKILTSLENVLEKNDHYEIIAQNEMFEVDEKNIFVQRFAQSMKNIQKKSIQFVHENGTSDAVFFAQKGMPVVLFRPKGGGAHQTNEWIDEQSLFKSYEVLQDFFQQL